MSTDLLLLTNDVCANDVDRIALKNNMIASKQLLSSENAPATGTIKVGSDLVYVYIYLNNSTSTSTIDNYVWNVSSRDEKNHIAAAWVETDKLSAVTSLDAVQLVETVQPPVGNSGWYQTQGDAILKSADVRSHYGYTGAGVKIGIISDGVDSLAYAQSTGDLPANVHVLSNTQSGDEGTAMLEIVHDIAPDAELYFHDWGDNMIDFNSAVDELANSGCTIICDDVSWFSEANFEDGIIASHINDVVTTRNVIYVSSAGNYAQGHYQGMYYSDGTEWNDFSRGTSIYKRIYYNVPSGATVRVAMQWDDRYGQSDNDYDLYLYKSDTMSLLALSMNYQGGYGNPYEYVSWTNYYSYPVLIEVDVKNFMNWADPKTLEVITYGGGSYDLGYNTNVADSVIGHAAASNVVAVGAIYSYDSGYDTIESYSSRGPSTVVYPAYQSRMKPDIVGIDGVSVTGAGGFGSPFYGTSAAAPHIAAIAAQLWSAYPAKSSSQIRSMLLSSATDIGSYGSDNTYGYGRADALRAVRSEFQPNAIKVTNDIPSTMEAGKSYPVHITMTNTGNMPWNSADGVYLGAVSDSSGDASKFSSNRIPIEAGGIVKPGESYTWQFDMVAPSTAGNYLPEYQLMWANSYWWFGQTVSKPISVIYVPDATIVGSSIPSEMTAGQQYPVSITLRNTGNMPWDSTNGVALGCDGYNATTPNQFGVMRMGIPAGTTVLPGQTYTFSFNMTPPYTSGTISSQYRMVWTGHQWFGNYTNATVQVTGPAVAVVSDTIPASMLPGETRIVSVTLRNAGTMAWPANGLFRLGAVGNSEGDAYLLNQSRQNVTVPVNPGDEYTFVFPITAPMASCTLHPAYRMVWEGKSWFGPTLTKTLTVPAPATEAVLVSENIPSTMEAGKTYPVSIRLRNTGNVNWSASGGFPLGAVNNTLGDAYKFNSTTRYPIDSGVVVKPGDEYSWNLLMTAPNDTGLYNVSYQMVWTGHKWFGAMARKQVNVVYIPNATVVGQDVPSSMVGGDRVNVSVTVRNTGNMPWNSTNGVGLGPVGLSATAADQLGVVRMGLPAGTTVLPGENYTFNFMLRAPYYSGTVSPKYRMVWTGHQWFGDYVNGSVAITSPDCTIVSDTIPSAMIMGESYPVSVTVRNTGTMTWPADNNVKLGLVGNTAGDAYLFNQSRQNVSTSTPPGENVTFNFTVSAPLQAGTYRPGWQMVWEGKTWFGPQLNKTVIVAPQTVDSVLVSESIPTTLEAGKPYNVSLTYRNTGNFPWNSTNLIGVGPVGYSAAGADQFGVTRMYLPAGTVVRPSESYTWMFNTTAPVNPGVYTASYETVWSGKKWFGPVVTKSVNVVYVPNATIVSQTLPSGMNGGDSQVVSVTVRNTGNMPWNSTNKIGLGPVGYTETTFDQFRVPRMYLPAGTEVLPGQSYTFLFTMKAPYSPGTVSPQYRMVWTGKQWFGDYVNGSIAISSPDAVIVSDTVPGSMVPGESYRVNVTVRNTGTLTWPANSSIKLGLVDNAAGDAYRFNQSRQTVMSPVAPGETYTVSFIMTAPTSGTAFSPKYQMVWEGKTWFGPMLSKSVAMTLPSPDAVVISEDIPTTMASGETYPVHVTVRNTGNMQWNSTNLVGLGPVGYNATAADQFGYTRTYLAPDVIVLPGETYTWVYDLNAPAAEGTYNIRYQTVWTGHKWFGNLIDRSVNVTGASPIEIVDMISVEPASLDPQIDYDSRTYAITQNVYETLVYYEGADGSNPKGLLATDWSHTNDNTVWTFYLRDNIRFHDNTSFNASAVKYSFDRGVLVNNPDGPFVGTGITGLLKGGDAWMASNHTQADSDAYLAEVAVKVINDTCVQFTLSRPHPEFYYVVSFPATAILSPSYERAHGGYIINSYDTSPVYKEDMCGTGPFRFASWGHNDKIVLQKNSDYWRAPATPDRVVIKIEPNFDVRLAALENGDTDIIDSVVDNRAQVLGASNAREYISDSMSVSFACFDEGDAPFNDSRVRQAFVESFDYQSYRNGFYSGTGNIPHGVIPRGASSYNEVVPVYQFNPTHARQLLEEAGYSNATPVTINITYNVGNTYRQAVAEMLKAEIENYDVGITIDVQSLSWSTYLDRVNKGNCDVFLMGWTSDYPAADQTLCPFAVSNAYFARMVRYSNTSMDDLYYNHYLTAATAEERQQAIDTMQTSLVGDYVYMPYIEPPVYSVYRHGLNGFHKNAMDSGRIYYGMYL